MDPVNFVTSKSLSNINGSLTADSNKGRELTRTISDTQTLMSFHKQHATLSDLQQHVNYYNQLTNIPKKQECLSSIFKQTYNLVLQHTHLKRPGISFDSIVSSPQYDEACKVFVDSLTNLPKLSINHLLVHWNDFDTSIKNITLGEMYINEYLKMERGRLSHENDADESYDVMDKITESIQRSLKELVRDCLGLDGVSRLEKRCAYLQKVNRNYELQLDRFSQNVCFAKLSGTQLPKLPESESVLFPELIQFSLLNKIEFCLRSFDLEDSTIYEDFQGLRATVDKEELEKECCRFCVSFFEKFGPNSPTYPENFSEFNDVKKIGFYLHMLMYESFVAPFKAICSLPVSKLVSLVTEKTVEETPDLSRSKQHYQSQFKDLNVLYAQSADPAVWVHPEVALTFLARTIVDIIVDSKPITRARLPETLCPFRTDLISVQTQIQQLLAAQVSWLTCMPFFKQSQALTFDLLYFCVQDSGVNPDDIYSVLSRDISDEQQDMAKSVIQKNLNPESSVSSLLIDRFKQFLYSAILEPYRYTQGQPKSPRKTRTYHSGDWLAKIAKTAAASMQISWYTHHNFYTKNHVSTLQEIIGSLVLQNPQKPNWVSTQMQDELTIMKNCRERYIDIKVATVFARGFLNEKAGIWNSVSLSDDELTEVSQNLKAPSVTNEKLIQEFCDLVETKLSGFDIASLATIAEDENEDEKENRQVTAPQSLAPLKHVRLSPSQALIDSLQASYSPIHSPVNKKKVPTTIIYEFKNRLRKTLSSRQARQSARRDLQAQVFSAKEKMKPQAHVESKNIHSTIKKIKIEFPLKPSLFIMLRSGLGSMKTA